MSSNEHQQEQVKMVEYDTTPTLALGVFVGIVAVTVIGAIGFVWWLVNWQGTNLRKARSAMSKKVFLDSDGNLVKPGELRKKQLLLVEKGGTDTYLDTGKKVVEKVMPISNAMSLLLKNKGFIAKLPKQVAAAPAPARRAPVKRAPAKRVAPKKVAPAKRAAAPAARKAPAKRAVAPAVRKVPAKRVAAPAKRAPAKRAAAPAKRAAAPAARKAPAKRVAPAARKAPAKRAAAPAKREAAKK